MSVQAFFEWCENTAIGEAIRNSIWLFPVVEAVHLLALAVLGGAVLVVDLRLLGTAMREQPVAKIARAARPWFIGGLIGMFVSGIPLFLSEALKCYDRPAFWVKMTGLLLAIIFVLTIRRAVVAKEADQITPALAKLTGAVSITLWFVVTAAGRWIGFS